MANFSLNRATKPGRNPHLEREYLAVLESAQARRSTSTSIAAM
jgi:hypothetical protein